VSWLQPLLDWVAAHPLLAGLALAMVAAAESLVLVGLLVPGAAVMFGAGALIGTGHLSFWPMVAWAVAGAIIGDAVSFWLGRRYGERLQTLWPLRRYPGLMTRGMVFFRRHGGKSVLVGRFVGPVRPIIPAVAGMMGMSPVLFLLVNAGSALLWAPAYLVPGMVFAASFSVAASVAGRLVALLLLLGLALWLGWRGLVRLRRALAVFALARYRRWRHRAPSWVLLALSSLHRRTGLAWWFAVLVLLAAVAMAAYDPPPRGWEQWLFVVASLPRPDWVDTGLWLAAQLGSLPAVAVGGVGGVLLLIAADGAGRALRLIAAPVLAATAGFAMAAVHGGAPPHLIALQAVAPSFPDLSLAALTALLLAAALLAAGSRPWLRRAALTSALLLVTAVALPQVALGLSWPLDAIGGAALGVVVAGLCVIGVGRGGSERSARYLLPALLLAMSIGVTLAMAFAPAPPRAAVPVPMAGVMNCSQPGRLPQRIGLFGNEGRFTALWQGRQESLSAALREAGWRQASPWDLHGMLYWLHPEPLAGELPALPRWHAGRLADITWVRLLSDGDRVILRGWRLAGGRWLMDVVMERLRSDGLIVVSDMEPAPGRLPVAALQRAGRLCALVSPESDAADDTGTDGD
jgi:undecaprenyl-diphosphatase